MVTKTFEAGDVIFEEGDVSLFVAYVIDGSAEVLRKRDGGDILLGHVNAGEYVGEMAAIENRPHQATIRATERLTVDIIPAGDFLTWASTDGDIARKLLYRMSARMQQLNRTYAEDATTPVRAPDKTREAAQAPVTETGAIGVTLLPGSPETEALLGSRAPIAVSLPFVVGRGALPNEPAPRQRVSLHLDDQRPFRLSRAHFAIEKADGRVWIHDLNSHLGTIVNGRPIGTDFSTDSAPLDTGENTVAAGGAHSPYVFWVVVNR